MKCPIDHTEMEEVIIKAGIIGSLVLIRKNPPFLSLGKYKTKKIIPWVCPKCGKVEFTTEPDKKEGELSS